MTTQVDGLNASYTVREVHGTDNGVDTPVPVHPSRTFVAVPGAYQSLGLEVNTVLSDSRTAGLRTAPAPRRVNRNSLSQYLDCGVGATGTPNADVYAVTLTALSRVIARGDSASTVTTQVIATATSRTTSNSSVRCASNGRLERAINNAIALEAAAQP